MANISIYYQNCRGLRTKLQTVYMNILSESYDIIILTETWLNPTIVDNMLVDSRYVVHRCDRDLAITNKQDGGGVLVASRRGLAARRCTITGTLFSNSDVHHQELPTCIEYVLLQIPTSTSNKYHLICALYIPPRQPYEVYKSFLNALQSVLLLGHVDKFYIIGDFNIYSLHWELNKFSEILPVLTRNSGEIDNYLINFLSLLQCSQFNIIKNINDRTLDLFISNSPDCICDVVLSPLVRIDEHHPPFSVLVPLSLAHTYLPKARLPRYRYHEADYQVINNDIKAIDWCRLMDDLPAVDAVDTFYEHIYQIIAKNVPLREHKSREYPVWFTKPLIHLFKDKNKAWVKWKKHGNVSDYEEFSLFRKRFKKLSEKCFNTYISSVEKGVRDNLKNFWAFVHRYDKRGFPQTMRFNGIESDDPLTICNLFSSFFGSVYEKSTVSNFSFDSHHDDNDKCNFNISDLNFSNVQVVKELKSLDVAKGSGPDNIPPLFLKSTASSISSPLTILYNKCLVEGVVPSVWKTANITPIHKAGAKDNIINYRPISLLSTLSKILERLVHNVIYDDLHKIILPQQHGFVKQRSTITNLLVYTNFLFTSMDERVQVDTVYTDFCKAFDKVDHELLLKKIAFNGIRGNLLRWFYSYIVNRTQKVVLNGYMSNTIFATSGVAQGSILGPLLFVLFINDIDQCFLNSHFLLYADDLKIFKQIKTNDDSILLQDDLNRLNEYCIHNKMHLSITKCKFITTTKKKNIIHFNYILNNTKLEKVNIIRDLGIILDTELHLHNHINHVISRAYQMYGFIMRTCQKFKLPGTYLYLFKALVRSQLEYGSVIWNPLYNKYKNNIESVQRKYLKRISCKCWRTKLSYDRLLQKFSLARLESRRTLFDIYCIGNILHNSYDCTDLTDKVIYRIPSRSLRIRQEYPHRLFCPNRTNTNAGQRAPLHRLMTTFNDHLSEHDIDVFSLSLKSFKNQVRGILSH